MPHPIPTTSAARARRQRLPILGLIAVLLAAFMSVAAQAAGHLVIERAWIREAPPSTMMLAGYALLRNDGDAPIEITAAQSKTFGDVSIHESVIEDGVSKMHELKSLRIAPGASVALVPGGKHLMLMDASAPVTAGAAIEIALILGDGSKVAAPFRVRAEEPSATSP